MARCWPVAHPNSCARPACSARIPWIGVAGTWTLGFSEYHSAESGAQAVTLSLARPHDHPVSLVGAHPLIVSLSNGTVTVSLRVQTQLQPISDESRKMTDARKFLASLSYRVATRLKSLSLQKHRSMTFRPL
jgi:hypothetical protein